MTCVAYTDHGRVVLSPTTETERLVIMGKTLGAYSRNVTPRGYGTSYEARVTHRQSAGIPGRTPMSANLGPTNLEANVGAPAYVAREDSRAASSPSLPLGWTKDDLKPRRNISVTEVDASTARVVDLKREVSSRDSGRLSFNRNRVTRQLTSTERDAMIDMWTERARKSIFPVRFIQRDVPECYRTEVAQRAASVVD